MLLVTHGERGPGPVGGQLLELPDGRRLGGQFSLLGRAENRLSFCVQVAIDRLFVFRRPGEFLDRGFGGVCCFLWRLLRTRKVSDVVWRLPPLELLERMSRTSVFVGLIAIAVGTALGFVWVDRLSSQYSFYDPKYVITLLVLVLYALYFRLARTTAWRGARASKLCVFNFVIVVLSFTVVNLYLSHSHRYF